VDHYWSHLAGDDGTAGTSALASLSIWQ
jgi:hypothetical protein